MEPVTKHNVKYGLKVVRGPDWIYSEQERGAKYGIIVGVNSSRSSVGVNWISENGLEVLNSETYRIGNKFNDGRCDLAIYEEPMDDEAFETLVETTEAWNAALELATDTIISEYRKNDLELDMNLDKLIQLISNLER